MKILQYNWKPLNVFHLLVERMAIICKYFITKKDGKFGVNPKPTP